MAGIPIRQVPTTAGAGTPPAAGTPAVAGWRFARLLSAPHRVGFFAAAVLMAVTALWWAAALAARHAGIAVPWAVPPPVAHGLAMSLAFMPLFMVGFLFTAGPRWLGLPDVPASSLVRPVVAMAGAWLVALTGFHAGAPWAALGIAVAAAAWSALVLRFARLVASSRAEDRLHARCVVAAAAVGAVAMALASAGVAFDRIGWARTAAQLAIWGFLAPVFAIVSHRMIPFFTASALPMLDAWRPNWLLAVMLTGLGVSAAAAVAEALWWPLPASAHLAVAAVQAPFAALMLWLAVRWGLVQSMRIRLLAMLHGGFVWLGVAMALAAASHATAGLSGGAASLGLAPQHALTMGYLGATLIAMITRVAAGHSGRPLAADRLAWNLYLLLQTAVVVRVAAALWAEAMVPLVLLAAAAWAAACTGWAWRYGGWLGRPRIDGRPG